MPKCGGSKWRLPGASGVAQYQSAGTQSCTCVFKQDFFEQQHTMIFQHIGIVRCTEDDKKHPAPVFLGQRLEELSLFQSLLVRGGVGEILRHGQTGQLQQPLSSLVIVGDLGRVCQWRATAASCRLSLIVYSERKHFFHRTKGMLLLATHSVRFCFAMSSAGRTEYSPVGCTSTRHGA